MNPIKKQWKIQYSFIYNYIYLILLLLSCVIYTLLEVRFSKELGNSLDVALTESIDTFRDFFKNIIILTAIFVIVRLIYCLIENYYIKSTLKTMKSKALEKISQKSLAEYSKKGASIYHSFFINDMNLLENNYVLPMIHALTDLISLIITLIALIQINWIVSIFILIVSFLPLLLTKVFIKPVQMKFGKYAETMQDYSTHLGEYFEGYQEFSNYGASNKIIGQHEMRSASLERTKREAYKKLDIMSNTIAISSIAITIGILLVGMFLALKGILTVGEVFAVSFISNGVSTPLSNLSDRIPKILSVKEVKNKYNSFVRMNDNDGHFVIKEDIQYIKLDNVSLNIEEKKILDNVSLTFERGKKYVLLGESGSGKSTLLKLIAGLYDNYDGKIIINGHSLKTIEKNSLFNIINYVPQQGIILDETIRNNIAVYRNDLNDSKIKRIIEFVGFDQRFMEFNSSLDAKLVNSGSELSGGEKQRLSLARALIQVNNVLFLDEATSALDHISYVDLEKKIANLNVTILISVEHRLEKELLMKYDEIIAMKDGRIVEQGRFTDLIEQKGLFYSLYQKQQMEE